MEERIKNMYNDAAKAFNKYLVEHDIEKFTNNLVAICEKYDNKADICGLIFWWQSVTGY